MAQLNTAADGREVMTPQQAADYLQLSRETIYRFIREGRLAASRIGSSYRIRKRDLDLFLLDNRSTSGFVPRLYTDEQIAQFVQDDVLSADAKEIVERLLSVSRASEQ